MAHNIRQMLNDFRNGLKELSSTNGDNFKTFMAFMGSVYTPGKLDLKTKELISVAIGAFNHCEYCIVYHVYKAYEAGASREEIMEAAMVAAAFGGGPAIAYSVTLLRESLDEFEGDFK